MEDQGSFLAWRGICIQQRLNSARANFIPETVFISVGPWAIHPVRHEHEETSEIEIRSVHSIQGLVMVGTLD